LNYLQHQVHISSPPAESRIERPETESPADHSPPDVQRRNRSRFPSTFPHYIFSAPSGLSISIGNLKNLLNLQVAFWAWSDISCRPQAC
jgi:hypothetical protein